MEPYYLAYLLYALTGALAGVSAGLLGIGGGLIIVPALFYIFSYITDSSSPDSAYLMHMALATSLASIIFTSISSMLAHHRKGAVLWKTAFILAPGICLGSWLGADFASSLSTAVLKPVFGGFEIFVGVLMLSNYQSKQHELSIKPVSAFTGGSIIGSISAIVGIGGGTLTVPFLHWHRIAIKNAIATSAACGFPIAVAGTLAYYVNSYQLSQSAGGYIQLDALTAISVFSSLFALVGARLAHRLHERSLRKVFAVFLLLLGARMLFS